MILVLVAAFLVYYLQESPLPISWVWWHSLVFPS